jgi:hypothetical protein
MATTGNTAQHDAERVSVQDWQVFEETLCLPSVSGLRESIKAGWVQPMNGCAKNLDW